MEQSVEEKARKEELLARYREKMSGFKKNRSPAKPNDQTDETNPRKFNAEMKKVVTQLALTNPELLKQMQQMALRSTNKREIMEFATRQLYTAAAASSSSSSAAASSSSSSTSTSTEPEPVVMTPYVAPVVEVKTNSSGQKIMPTLGLD
jgi:hypothetical protein